jgi:hypothetical protein
MGTIRMGMSYIFEGKDWTDGLKKAESPEDLLAFIETCSPFVDDAILQAKNINHESWNEWIYFKKMAYEESVPFDPSIMDKFGSIMIPENFILAGEVSLKYHAPLGCSLIRLKEEVPHLLRGSAFK